MEFGDWDGLWIHAGLATMQPGEKAYGAVENAAIAVKDGRIAWLGGIDDLPASPDELAEEVHDVGGRWITPGLIDCHTHVVFGGNRAAEFEMRLEGATYEEISRAGGGIRSTVTATRSASEFELVASALPRVDHLLAEGVTTLEIKSGYGLDVETECRMLSAARQIGQERNVSVVTSFLGAHALPPEYEGRDDDYIDFVCAEALPEVARLGLADAVDGFSEGIAFTPEQMSRVFDKARELGLPVKLHAEQLSDLKGAVMAASYGALSADHLEYLAEDGVRAMADAGTVAVLLPGAFYFLRETQLPPLDLLREHGVPIALATDCNPGSSPVTSLLLTLNMACTLFRMTPEETLTAVTRNAARALGLDDRGVLTPGLRADFAVWSIERPGELSYRVGFNPLYQTVFGGKVRN